MRFDSYSEEWLDLILNCRNGNDLTDYDLVIGGVADDKVFNTVELFFDGLIDEKEAIVRLRYNRPTLQCVSARKKRYHYCILKEAKRYDCKSDFTSEKIQSYN